QPAPPPPAPPPPPTTPPPVAPSARSATLGETSPAGVEGPPGADRQVRETTMLLPRSAKRRGGDSNPRCRKGTHDFESCRFNRAHAPLRGAVRSTARRGRPSATRRRPRQHSRGEARRAVAAPPAVPGLDRRSAGCCARAQEGT